MFEQEPTQPDAFLTAEDVKELLNEEHEDAEMRQGIMGYPSRPLYRDMAYEITCWIETRYGKKNSELRWTVSAD